MRLHTKQSARQQSASTVQKHVLIDHRREDPCCALQLLGHHRLRHELFRDVVPLQAVHVVAQNSRNIIASDLHIQTDFELFLCTEQNGPVLASYGIMQASIQSGSEYSGSS